MWICIIGGKAYAYFKYGLNQIQIQTILRMPKFWDLNFGEMISQIVFLNMGSDGIHSSRYRKQYLPLDRCDSWHSVNTAVLALSPQRKP
jgi:hypothetical protein